MALTGQPETLVRQREYPITVTLFSEFLRNPPQDYFEVREGPGHPLFLHRRQKINLCTHSTKWKEYFPDSMGSEMKINSMEELDSLADRLLRNPTFFDVSLERDSKIPMDRYRYVTKGDFVAIVWPQHPAIRGQILQLLDRAKADLSAGRKFAIELDFSSAIKDWFKSLFAADDDAHSGCYIYSMYDCKYARLCITNDSEFLECYGCTRLESLVLWVICLPCCILTCPCYRLHRCCTVVDHGGDIQGLVGYQHLTPIQSGQDSVMILINQMRREAQTTSNTMYTTVDPQVAPAGAPVYSQQPTTQQPHHPWPQAGGTPGYPVGTHQPPQQPPHSTQPVPTGMPPSYEETIKESTSDVANLI